MLKSLILRKIDAVEAELGASMDYLRHLLRVSTSAFFKFARILPISEHRGGLPEDVRSVLRIAATQVEDCGDCVSIEVKRALRQGVDEDIIAAVMERDPQRLPDELARVHAFSQAVIEHDPAADDLREEMRQRYGEAGLVEMAYGMACGSFYPRVKRTLGFARSCSRVDPKLS